ncbi:hypothetical protein ACLKA7_001267 [Drosophila subpalustris]
MKICLRGATTVNRGGGVKMASSFGRLNIDDSDHAILPDVYLLDSAHEPLLGRHVVLCDDDEISHGEIWLLLVPLGLVQLRPCLGARYLLPDGVGSWQF